MKNLIFFTFIFLHLAFSDQNHILYLMQKNKYQKALFSYKKLYEKTKIHNFEILQKMAIILLKKGISSPNIKKRHLSMFGAGFAISEYSSNILEKGLMSNDLESQMIALYFIDKLEDAKTDQLLLQAMKSKFLKTRVEAACILAKKKNENALSQIKTLIQKIPMLKPYFVPCFGFIGNKDATNILKNMLFDKDPNVRLQTIFTIANCKRDDLLYLLKKIKHSSSYEKEAVLYALGSLNDLSSLEYIKKYQNSSLENLKLASCFSCFKLQDKSSLKGIKNLAKKENIFAISLLGKLSEFDESLYDLLSSDNKQIKYNSAISLLFCKNAKCIDVLKEIFQKKLFIRPLFSKGRSLSCWHFENGKDIFHIKEYLLQKAKDLQRKDFIKLASFICKKKINELIPSLFDILIDLKEEDFLKKQSQKIGSPFIRNYANLSLYKLKKEKIYFQNIKKWINRNKKKQIMLFGKISDNIEIPYTISKEETSKLLLDCFIAIAEAHTIEGIDILLDEMQNSHPLNRYLLAGILLKAIE